MHISCAFMNLKLSFLANKLDVASPLACFMRYASAPFNVLVVFVVVVVDTFAGLKKQLQMTRICCRLMSLLYALTTPLPFPSLSHFSFCCHCVVCLSLSFSLSACVRGM